MIKDQLRAKIKSGCEQRGWGPMDLARATEISPEAIRRFMTGRGEVSTRVLLRMCQALNIDAGGLR